MERRVLLAFGIIIIVVAVGAYYWPTMRDEPEPQGKQILELDSFIFEEVELNWLVVGGFKLKKGDTVVYVDPKDIYRKDFDILEPADFIIITHDHTPHYSPLDIYSLTDDDTVWITAPRISVTRQNQVEVYAGDILVYEDVSFEFTPSYNIDKRRPSGDLFHPPVHENIGVIIDFYGTRIYHSGDTDAIPEMAEIQTDIALLPVSGYAWMTADDAVEAVELLKQSSDLKYAIPIHYGYNQGTDFNARYFAEQANCSVVILPRLFEK